MRLQVTSEDPRSGPQPTTATTRRRIPDHLRQLILVVVVGGLVIGFFVAVYTALAEPIGWDTARYLDQTNLATRFGLSGAAHLVLPRPSKLLASRVGFPTTVMGLAGLLHTSLFEAAALVPAAAAAAIALAAGAFVSYSLRRGVWDLIVVAIIVGTSTGLVRLMGGTYTDNLIAEALFAAALVPLLASVRDGRGFIAAIVLLAAGGLAHPAFFKFMVAILAVVAAVYAPASWKAWRRREAPLLATPSVRLGLILGGASGIAAVGIYGFLKSVPDEPILQRYLFLRRIKEDVPLYRLYVTAPLAAIGGASLVRTRAAARARSSSPDGLPDRSTLQFVLVTFGAWFAVTAIGILALVAGRRSLPAHRFLAFLLPLPILVALGVLAIARFLAGRRSGRVAIGVAAVCVAGLVALGILNYRAVTRRGVEFIDSGKVHDAVAAATYLNLAHVPVDHPVVIVVSDSGPTPRLFIPEEAHIFRSAFPAERIPSLYFYVGTPENFLAGQPTIVSTGEVRQMNIISRDFFDSVKPILAKDPVALLLSSYNPAYTAFAAQHPDWLATQNLVVLQGPRLSQPFPDPSFPTAPHRLALPALGSAALIVLVVLGAGWALALLPAGMRPFEVLAISPGFGIAALVVAGITADPLGIRLVGWGASLPALVVAGVGWAIAGVRLARRGPEAVLAV
jgi:hypothetical protein